MKRDKVKKRKNSRIGNNSDRIKKKIMMMLANRDSEYRC